MGRTEGKIPRFPGAATAPPRTASTPKGPSPPHLIPHTRRKVVKSGIQQPSFKIQPQLLTSWVTLGRLLTSLSLSGLLITAALGSKRDGSTSRAHHRPGHTSAQFTPVRAPRSASPASLPPDPPGSLSTLGGEQTPGLSALQRTRHLPSPAREGCGPGGGDRRGLCPRASTQPCLWEQEALRSSPCTRANSHLQWRHG